MNTDIERKKVFLIRFAWFAVVIGIVIFLCRKAIPQLMPFVIALFVSILLQPAVRLLHNKLKFPKTLAVALLVFLFYAIVGLLFLLLGARLISALRSILTQIPTLYSTRVEPFLISLSDQIRLFAARIDPDTALSVDTYLDNISTTLAGAVSSISFTAVRTLTNYAVSVPGMLLNVLFTLIGTVYIASDIHPLRDWILAQLSERNRMLVTSVLSRLGSTLRSFIKGYGIIFLITFSELIIGLSFFRVGNVVLISAAIAIIDILPVLGCGTILIPWSIISAFYGEYARAAELIIFYIIITIIRNFVEPRIVGKRVGLHPIVTLISLVIGTKVFGSLGFLGLPIALALMVNLNDCGVIHVFKPVGGAQPAAPAAGEAAPSAPASDAPDGRESAAPADSAAADPHPVAPDDRRKNDAPREQRAAGPVQRVKDLFGSVTGKLGRGGK